MKKKTADPTFFLVKMSTSTTDLKNYRKIAPFSPCHFLWLGLSSRVTLLLLYVLVGTKGFVLSVKKPKRNSSLVGCKVETQD